MDKRTAILDAAERRARQGGYHGFSFRDVASDVGIKSASVHYHFPTKEDLGEALAERYIKSILAALGEADQLEPVAAFDRMADLFLKSHEVDDLMCLCGVFGAEAAILPDAVRIPVDRFFRELIAWLASSFGDVKEAELAVATLEGGLIISRAGKQGDFLRNLVKNWRSRYV